MPTDVVQTIEQFDALKGEWESVYDQDSAARVFMSWPWIRAYLPIVRRRPLFLCYRPSDATSYAAFLPLALDGFPRRRALLNRDIYPFGNPAGDYAGLIAKPAHERDAIEAFSQRLSGGRWDNFYAHDVVDERVFALIHELSPGDFRVASLADTPCPYIPLPSTWDEYLQTRLHKRFRGELRKSIRLVERLPDFRVALIDRHNVERTVDLTLQFSQVRYRSSPRYRREQRALLLNCFETGCLLGVGLWSGSALLASVIAFTDARRRELCAYKTAFNPKFADISPGTAATAYMIRHAIENRFDVYDFSRGGERYKSYYGTQLRYTHHYTVTRVGVRTALGNAVRPLIRAPGRVAEKVLSRVPA